MQPSWNILFPCKQVFPIKTVKTGIDLRLMIIDWLNIKGIVKGIVSLISINFNQLIHAKMTMPDILDPRNLNSDQKWRRESGAFSTRKVFNYDNFSIASHKQEMHKSLLQITRKYKVQRKNNMDILFILDQSKLIVVNRTLLYLIGMSFESTLTVPLNHGYSLILLGRG